MFCQSPSAIASASSSLTLGIALEEGVRIAEGGLAQAHEAVDVPVVDQALVGIDIDREIEEIRHHRHDLAVSRQVARLQHVDALEDQDIRPVDDLELSGSTS